MLALSPRMVKLAVAFTCPWLRTGTSSNASTAKTVHRINARPGPQTVGTLACIDV